MLRARRGIVHPGRRVRRVPVDGRAVLPRGVAFLSRSKPQSLTAVVSGSAGLERSQWKRLGPGRHSDCVDGRACGASPASPDMGVLRVLSGASDVAPVRSVGVVLSMKDATRAILWHRMYVKRRSTKLACDLADGAAE